ncbi:GDYXXLXY domain-containing protein [Flagellimonas sp. CMM7]|uniref:GDYXXLXY domain-containing protein n=1 Tax=Flagellimonas sp. CMM7 TaxID=2654676 RepID=UPI0013D026E2|nr:GDYXXLXY domain-containing protein [Flagellimonas sp. CMM7]UII78259.1 GDYXXLXY domain-containing protein [Flagellimonas sp. CMM7]
MSSKKVLFPLFILVALAQLYVPAKMIWDKEDVLDSGKEYKFKTAPIDPSDPFRGKYIVLSYDENTIEIPDEHDWIRGEVIYVSITEDKKGFAKIKSVSKEKIDLNQNFIKAKVGFITSFDTTKLTIDYPFDRFYMEESKAYDAELTHRESQRDTTKITYALVNVKNGDAVLKDVLIDGIPIRELVKAKQDEN